LYSNRFFIFSVLASIVLVLLSLIIVVASFLSWPESLYPYSSQQSRFDADDVVIHGSASFDRDSYLIGELTQYEIRLEWDSSKVAPELETFRNGIGFFPFNRQEIIEQQLDLDGERKQYLLRIVLQAVDVDPGSSYTLAPPTVYFQEIGDNTGQLQSYRIPGPSIHIGSYYPEDVSKISLLDYKYEIAGPLGLNQTILILSGLLLFIIAWGLIFYFGRVRRKETLSHAECLWREFQDLRKKPDNNRNYLLQCELIFTDLLQARTKMSPVSFWVGKEPDEEEWKETVSKARDIFSRAYLPEDPDDQQVQEINTLLETLFSHLVEEDRLKIEQVPSFSSRIIRQPVVLINSGVIMLLGISILTLASFPEVWSSQGVMQYNQAVSLLSSDDAIETKYERFSELAEQLGDERIRAAALYNYGILATEPELSGIDIYQQEALLAVMFQEQKVFMDALLHSLTMEDPFLLVAIIRDSIRFLTQGETALKSAVRIAPYDDDIGRNLELVLKRRKAYAQTILELLQEGEESSGMGELQRQSLMDLEQFMQMEMPEEFAELEEGKDDKDYFILEGF
jgi:hypothetical protein